MNRVRWALAAALLALLAADARCGWDSLGPGLRYQYLQEPGPQRIHAVEIDLAEPSLEVQVTRGEHRMRTTGEFARLYDAEVAVNGDFYDWRRGTPRGLGLADGRRYHAPDGEAFIGFWADNRPFMRPPSSAAAMETVEVPEGLEHGVGGGPVLVWDGSPVPPPADCARLCRERFPRTASGLSADGRRLYLVVVDGESPEAAGMTIPELAALMTRLGAHRALNLDGGGSTTMWVRAKGGIVNHPADGAERVVANHLGVIRRGG